MYWPTVNRASIDSLSHPLKRNKFNIVSEENGLLSGLGLDDVPLVLKRNVPGYIMTYTEFEELLRESEPNGVQAGIQSLLEGDRLRESKGDGVQ